MHKLISRLSLWSQIILLYDTLNPSLNTQYITYLVQVERRALGTIVVVAINMQHLLAFDRKQSRENALGQAGA